VPEHLDEKEIQPPEKREAALFDRLPKFLAEVAADIEGWRKRLDGIDLPATKSRNAFAAIPVLRKPELMAAQAVDPPFGGLIDVTRLGGGRLFMSPGPVWEPFGIGDDPMNAARAFFAAGVRPGDVVLNAFAYHLTPGGFILDQGALALGATVFPGGGGNTEQLVEAASILRASVFAGTPDYLKVVLDRAAELKKEVSGIRRAIVSGGALFPKMREDYRPRGIKVSQAYATADLGVIAFETWSGDQLCPGMVLNEEMIVEIVRPGTDDPVPDGEVGEVVVTNFNRVHPLIRFGTGDLSRIVAGSSPCGYTNRRIAGWLGRADQRTKVKGMFVDPAQVGELVKRSSGVRRARLVVDREGDADVMTLHVEPLVDAALDAAAIGKTLSEITGLRGRVEIVRELPNDGKVIDDRRSYG
jgi:phenylacetate-CoA ligase